MSVSTSFGLLETLVEKSGNVVAELATFNKNGRPHIHDQYEICHVLSGSGKIIQLVNGSRIVSDVTVGDMVTIPSHVSHWMEVENTTMEILIVYSDKMSH